MSIRPVTPKEFSAAIGELRSPKWVREQCALFVRTKGKRGIRTVNRQAPYLIDGAEIARFRPSIESLVVATA